MSMNQTSLSRQDGRQKRQPRVAGMVVKGIVTSVALAAVAACQQGSQQQAAGGGTPPALPVGVIQAQVSPVGLSENLQIGRAHV